MLRGRRPLSGLPESYSIAFWRVVVAQGLSSYCETASYICYENKGNLKTTGPFEMLILIHWAPFHHRQFRMSYMSVFLFWIPKAWEEGKLTEENCKCGNFYW